MIGYTPAMRERLARGLLLVAFCAIASTGAALAQAAVDWNDRRITAIEAQNLHGRLQVLESDMSEIKLLSRMVAGIVISQLAITAAGAIRRAGRVKGDPL